MNSFSRTVLSALSILAIGLVSLIPNEASAACPGKSDYLKISLKGSYKGRFSFKDNFHYRGKSKLPNGLHELKFEHSDKTVLLIQTSHIPDKEIFNTSTNYYIKRHFFPSIGGAVHTLSIDDEKGFLISFSNSHSSPFIKELSFKVVADKSCPFPKKGNSAEGKGEMNFKGKTESSFFAGKSADVEIDGNKYHIQGITALLRRSPSKDIAFEGTKTRVSYILYRK